jgi:ABC-2 type transport system permease protein
LCRWRSSRADDERFDDFADDGAQLSGFVPTDSMPAGLRWFADNQPFTPITDTLRRLLGDEHVGGAGIAAVAWCLAIAAAGFVWAGYLYNRRPAP